MLRLSNILVVLLSFDFNRWPSSHTIKPIGGTQVLMESLGCLGRIRTCHKQLDESNLHHCSELSKGAKSVSLVYDLTIGRRQIDLFVTYQQNLMPLAVRLQNKSQRRASQSDQGRWLPTNWRILFLSPSPTKTPILCLPSLQRTRADQSGLWLRRFFCRNEPFVKFLLPVLHEGYWADDQNFSDTEGAIDRSFRLAI